jgi:hypothetical protein
VHNPALGLVMGGTIVVAIGARAIYYGLLSPAARMRRRVSRLPRVAISKAQDGLVRLVGRAHPVGAPLLTPVTQRPCVVYCVVIEQRMKNDWAAVWMDTQACPFLLEDETGTALVDAPESSFSTVLVPDETGGPSVFGGEGEDMEKVLDLLRAAGVETWGLFSAKVFRYAEAAVLPGGGVSVGGRCTHEVALDGDRGTYREPPQRPCCAAATRNRCSSTTHRKPA